MIKIFFLLVTLNNAQLINIFVILTIFCLVYIFFKFEIVSSTNDNAYLILKMVKTTSARYLNWYYYCHLL